MLLKIFLFVRCVEIVLRRMGLFDRFKRKPKEAEKEKIKLEKPDLSKLNIIGLSETIENWQKQVSILEDHPLSQARVVNTQILESLGQMVGNIDTKLADLRKLDEILEALEVLKTQKKQEETPKIPDSALEFALTRVGHISVKDRDVLQLLERDGALSAEETGERLSLTRSTISYRLNRLYSMGLLEKTASGRVIKFRVPNFKNNLQ